MNILLKLKEEVKSDLVNHDDIKLAQLILDGLIFQELRERTSLFDEMTLEAKEQLMKEFKEKGISSQGLDILRLILEVQVLKARALRLDQAGRKIAILLETA